MIIKTLIDSMFESYGYFFSPFLGAFMFGRWAGIYVCIVCFWMPYSYDSRSTYSGNFAVRDRGFSVEDCTMGHGQTNVEIKQNKWKVLPFSLRPLCISVSAALQAVRRPRSTRSSFLLCVCVCVCVRCTYCRLRWHRLTSSVECYSGFPEQWWLNDGKLSDACVSLCVRDVCAWAGATLCNRIWILRFVCLSSLLRRKSRVHLARHIGFRLLRCAACSASKKKNGV